MAEETPLKRKNISWLASYPKSGNTWLRAFLAAYIGGVSDINALGAAGMGDLQSYFHQALAPYPLEDMEPKEVLLLRPAALMHQATMLAKREGPLFLKTHFSNSVIEGAKAIPCTLTDKSVYILRDPRDVCVSFAEHIGATIDKTVTLMADPGHLLVNKDTGLFHHLGHWSLHVQSWVQNAKDEGTLVIRYEDMLNHPHRTFGQIVQHFGIEGDDERFEQALEQTKFENLKAQEQEKGFREKGASDTFFTRGKSGGWKDKMTDKQASQIQKDHSEIMELFGYL